MNKVKWVYFLINCMEIVWQPAYLLFLLKGNVDLSRQTKLLNSLADKKFPSNCNIILCCLNLNKW